VPQQAFLDVSSAENPAFSYGADGIAGLGFDSLSNVDSLVNETHASTGRSLLYNLFAANPGEPNFITFALQRSSDPTDDVQGTFSIGECLGDHNQIHDLTITQENTSHNMPKLQTLLLSRPGLCNLPHAGMYC
jgi:saccharopepsin